MLINRNLVLHMTIFPLFTNHNFINSSRYDFINIIILSQKSKNR